MSAYQQTTHMANKPVQERQAPGGEAIVVENFTKSYGSNRVVDHVTFTVHQGEVFALLGPNGAGKTTTIETLEGYRTPDQGNLHVLGLNPIRDSQALKSQIGVMLQQDGLYPGLTAREVLHLFASYYKQPQHKDLIPTGNALRASAAHSSGRISSIDNLLERVGLSSAARTRCRRLSGGQKRRLALAVALVGNPALVFLDEPTAGMDPQARLATWEIIRALKSAGVTVLLTTHLMDEAERLADRVAIIDHGRLIALDTPAGLTGVQNATVVRFVAPAGLDCTQLAALPAAHKAEEIRPGSYLIETDAAPVLVAALAAWLRDQQITLTELRVGHGSLEDLFLRLTGAEIRE
jgi:ABC-2 type transport system ATP-binding protein